MPRDGSGNYTLPPGTVGVSATLADVSDVNSRFSDLESDANSARPVAAGGTGATTAIAARAALGVEILDEDDMVSNSATKLASQQSIKAFVKFSKEYQSTGQTMVAAGLLTLAHNLGAEPKMIRLYAKCTTAEGGYGVGTKFDISAVTARTASAADARTFSVQPDATNILIRNGDDSSFISSVRADNGLAFALTRANWDLYVEAWA